MICPDCLREMPDAPCAVVTIVEYKSPRTNSTFTANIKLRGSLVASFDNHPSDKAAGEKAFLWGQENGLSLHFHRVKDLSQIPPPKPVKIPFNEL